MHLQMPDSRFNVPLDQEGSSPDDVRDTPTMPDEDAHSAIGVSISRVQTRLISPQTPAAEKAAAMSSMLNETFDGNEQCQEAAPSISRQEQHQGLHVDALTPPRRQHSVHLPSPCRVAPTTFEKSGDDRQEYRQAGPTSVLSDLNVRRYLSSFNLPSLPRTTPFKDFSIPTLSSILSSTKSRSPTRKASTRHKRASTLDDLEPGLGVFGQPEWQSNQDLARRQGSLSAPSESPNGYSFGISPRFTREVSSSRVGPHRKGSYITNGTPPKSTTLRRVNSDQSLMLRRAASTGSSLGDDSRWENVQEQVNSRIKAIKDSLQDSNLRLPKMPHVSIFHLDAIRPDFTKSWAYDDDKEHPQTANLLNSGVFGVSETVLQHRQTAVGTDSERKAKSAHPFLDDALEQLTGDIVVMGGYRGSILRSAKPPNRQLWVPVKVGLNIRRVNLEVGLQPEDEETMADTIVASGMLSHIGPVDMGRRLLKRLRACRNAQNGKLRVHDYGYDWRLSPHLLSRRLISFLETLQSNASDVPAKEKGATMLAHSMGGLITRHVVNQRPELVAGVVFAGVPQHCVNILGPLRNGDEVLLSSKVLTAQVNFTLRSSYVLLPEDGKCFVNKETKEEYPVNFFDIEAWKEYAWSPCIAPPLPAIGPPETKSMLGSMADMLPSLFLLSKKASVFRSKDERATLTNAANTASAKVNDVANLYSTRALDPQMAPPPNSTSPQCTISPADAFSYLKRTLDKTLAFKTELAHHPSHTNQNLYPPFAILYATNTPTVAAARVSSRDAIRRSDAYDDLQFGSGDGVCLARAAMLPEGYACAKGGRVKTERGHVGLLGDLEAVGKCLSAVIEGRRKGTGLGVEMKRA